MRNKHKQKDILRLATQKKLLLKTKNQAESEHEKNRQTDGLKIENHR